MFGIYPKNLEVILKYLGYTPNHLQNQVMLFKPKTIDEANVQENYLENIGNKKGEEVIPNKKTTNMLPRKGRRSGKERR